jgi:hypothetical protein
VVRNPQAFLLGTCNTDVCLTTLNYLTGSEKVYPRLKATELMVKQKLGPVKSQCDPELDFASECSPGSPQGRVAFQ